MNTASTLVASTLVAATHSQRWCRSISAGLVNILAVRLLHGFLGFVVGRLQGVAHFPFQVGDGAQGDGCGKKFVGNFELLCLLSL